MSNGEWGHGSSFRVLSLYLLLLQNVGLVYTENKYSTESFFITSHFGKKIYDLQKFSYLPDSCLLFIPPPPLDFNA